LNNITSFLQNKFLDKGIFILKIHCILVLAIGFATLAFGAEYDRITQWMDQLINSNPAYVQGMDIGKNDQGITIRGIRIANPNFVEGEKINQLLVGVHHGNERNSSDLCLKTAEKIIAKMKDPASAEYKLLSRSVFYVIPVLNIGGFNASSRYERNASNSSIDPNRDYPDPCVGNKYYQLASVRNLAYFIDRENIIGAVTVHGYIGTFTYPWGINTSNTHTADHDLYTSMAKASVAFNGYRYGTHTDVIYAASGSFEDWAYHKFGIWTMLLELKSSSGDLSKDVDCLIKYFTLVPTARSADHAHPAGNCRSTLIESNGRP